MPLPGNLIMISDNHAIFYDDDDDDDNNDDDDDDDDDIQIFAVPNMQRNAINVEPVLNFKLKKKG